MERKGLILASLLGAAALGAPGDIYQWTYDQLVLGPGWTGHVFANRTGEVVLGLELHIVGAEPAQVLVAGGWLKQTDKAGPSLSYGGEVAPGGLIVVALPRGSQVQSAAWVTQRGPLPIPIEPPLIRAQSAEGWVHYRNLGNLLSLMRARPEVELGREVQQTIYELAWIWQVNLEALRPWEGFPLLVLVDGRRSFSPLGSEIVAWQWTWDDGLVQEGPVVVRGFEGPGQFTVIIKVWDREGHVQVLRWPIVLGVAELQDEQSNRPPDEGGGSKNPEEGGSHGSRRSE